jgi:hypothetical protein
MDHYDHHHGAYNDPAVQRAIADHVRDHHNDDGHDFADECGPDDDQPVTVEQLLDLRDALEANDDADLSDFRAIRERADDPTWLSFHRIRLILGDYERLTPFEREIFGRRIGNA